MFSFTLQRENSMNSGNSPGRTSLFACIALFALSLSGCGLGDWASEKIGLKESQEAKQERLLKQEQGDKLVAEFSEKLERQTQSSGGYVHHEGLTPDDPWGNRLQVTYSQRWSKEVLTVRSAGPDGRFETDDDLVRIRETNNVMGTLSGIPSLVFWLVFWPLLGVFAYWLSTVLSSRREKKRMAKLAKQGDSRTYRRKRKHPFLSLLAMAVLGPIACVFYGFMLIGFLLSNLVSMDFDFFDDFDIGGFDLGDFGHGGGIDLDIDIDLDL